MTKPKFKDEAEEQMWEEYLRTVIQPKPEMGFGPKPSTNPNFDDFEEWKKTFYPF